MAPTFQSITTATSGTCNKPVSTASGDTLVAAVFGVGSVTPAASSGWTQSVTVNDGSFSSLTMLTLIAGGSEPSSYTFTGPVLVDAVAILRITGAASPVIDATPTSVTSTGVVPSQTTTVANDILILAAISASATAPDLVPPGTMTERAEFQSGNGFGILGINTESFAGPGATGTRTEVSTSSTVTLATMISLREGSSDITSVVPSPAASTWAMSTPTARAAATSVVAASTWAMPSPSAKANAVAPAAASTWAMPVPTVQAISSVVASTMTWAMGIPTTVMTAGATIPDPAISTWAMNAPSALVLTSPPAATSAWEMGVPAVQIESGVSIPDPAASSWQMGPPSVAITASPPAAAASWAMVAPSAKVVVSAPSSDVNWQMGIPEIGYGVVVDVAASTWSMETPSIALGQTPPEASSFWEMGVPDILMTAEVPSMEMSWGIAVQNAGQTWPGSSVRGSHAVVRSDRGITGRAQSTTTRVRGIAGGPRPIRGEIHGDE